MYSPNQQQQFFDQDQSLNGLSAHTSVNAMPMQSYSSSHPTLPAAIARRRQSSFSSVMSPPLSAGPSSSSFDPANSQAWFGTSLDSTGSSFSQNMFGGRDIIVSPSTSTPMDGFGTADDDEAAQRNLQQMFEKRRRRRESHNAVERRRRDNINDKIQELSLLLPEHLLDNPPPGSTNVVATPGVASSSAQKNINKGTILKMSVDHIRNLKSDAARYQARIKELEAMLEAAKSGEFVDFDAIQLGRAGQAPTPTNDMNVFPPQYQQHQPYGASAPVPLRSQQQSLNLNDSNRRPQPHQRTGSLQFQQQFGNLQIDANPRGSDAHDSSPLRGPPKASKRTLDPQPPSPKNNARHLASADKLAWSNNDNQLTTLVKIPPMANWPTSTQSNFATDLDISRRSSMRTEDDFMDGASIRKMSNASASSGSTQVEERFHYHRLSYQQNTDKEYFPVEMTTGGDTLESTILSDFSWMQRPTNTFPVPTGKQQTNKENVIHYIMRYVMNGFHTAPLLPRSSGVGRILDIGSGSGIWAIEMATAYPRCEVVGIDLLCPGIGHDNIPENCTFKTVDVLAGLPFDNESFDYVFVRNMTLELDEDGYRSLINDSYRILRPGGYLEIAEPDMELKNSGPVTQRFLHLYAKAFKCIGINAQLANCLPSLINTSWFATQASSACTWTVAIPVGKRWKSRIARLLALYLLSEFRSCKNMVCSVAGLSEEDYDDVMMAVKQELLSVVDTHIIWRTVLAHKEDSTANCGRGFHMNPRLMTDK